MANLPTISPEEVEQLIPVASDVTEIGSGGQKRVFRGDIEGTAYALKFALTPIVPEDIESEEFVLTDVELRAQREVDTMRECKSPHIVKLGPVGLEFVEVDDEHLLFFSEEFIEGKDLRTLLRDDGRLSEDEVVLLGLHIAEAIHELWQFGKIHRDIKPANIMRREAGGDFVLLDAGLVFDIVGDSLSVSPVGTVPYFSPEQFDFTNRRTVLDFRSDVFSLGVTMYELLTGTHPFWTPGDSSHSLYNKITTESPQPPSKRVDGVPEELDEIILRMLGKSPHLRYRRCDQLLEALRAV